MWSNSFEASFLLGLSHLKLKNEINSNNFTNNYDDENYNQSNGHQYFLEEALKYLLQADQLKQNNSKLKNLIGTTLFYLKQNYEAVSFFNAAINYDQKNINYRLNIVKKCFIKFLGISL